MSAVSIYGAYDSASDHTSLRQTDIILPRLGLMQFASKPVKERTAVAGAFINSATGETIIPHDKPQKVIPLCWWLEWVEWNPIRSEPNRILNRSLDPHGDLARMSDARIKVRNDKGKEVYRVNEAYTFTLLLPEVFGNYDDMAVFSFQKTGHYTGKLWLNKIRALKSSGVAVPMPAAMWDLGAKLDSKDGDEWMTPVVGSGVLLDIETAKYTMHKAAECRERKEAMMNAALASHEAAADSEHADADKQAGATRRDNNQPPV
jgi:hypothetical protein